MRLIWAILFYVKYDTLLLGGARNCGRGTGFDRCMFGAYTQTYAILDSEEGAAEWWKSSEGSAILAERWIPRSEDLNVHGQ